MPIHTCFVVAAAMMWSISCFAVELPEPLESVCSSATLPDNDSINRCKSIYSAAADGSAEHVAQIGMHIQQLSLPNGPGDMLSIDELSRQIKLMARAVKWFRLAHALNYGDATYYLAQTLSAAYITALLPAHLPEIADRSAVLLPQALELGSPAEAVSYALRCAHQNDARCMVMLADFIESSYGFDRDTNRLNAAEWLVKAAFRWSEVGARQESLSIYERLTRNYPDYPYLGVLREHLFPIPKPPLPREATPAPKGSA